MNNPIQPKIGGTFIPVKNIEAARDWYCDLLGMQATDEIVHGHLYVVRLQDGHNLILDQKIYAKRKKNTVPLFHFNTDDIQQSHQYIHDFEAHNVSEIEFDEFFTFEDPDGNVLMICECSND
ncbi:VOC family protein [Jeotgalibacillus sp. R-1-5s-1]|uniref:VOC family protein n=1 Tax=Jeotgalibacillus sp. R-1-5s-1 TaxID=2555897 RepID=UPI00106A8D4A|nr:VOC family protein [Jeotgalibacillus sp. R-1-5s-1]TFD98391.1 VOC family protein [Jeotgalibacillus sp. R-1-5s-1]